MLFVSPYDLMILDWVMPGCSGIEFLSKLRSRGIQTPVLMLTGMADVDNRITGLDSGADDYLTKPFNSKELLSRVRALLRRPAQLQSGDITIGRFSLNTQRRQLVVGSETISLTKQEYFLLEFLMRHPDQAFAAPALVERAWSGLSECSPDGVRVHMFRLRKKLDGVDGNECPIKTMHGHGYIFVSTAAGTAP